MQGQTCQLWITSIKPDTQSSTLSNHPNCPAWTLGNPPDDSPRLLGQCFNGVNSPHTMSETSQVTDDLCHPMQHHTMTKPCCKTSIEAPRDPPRSLGGTIDYMHPVYTVSETHHVLNLAMPKPSSPCDAALKPSQQDTILGDAQMQPKAQECMGVPHNHGCHHGRVLSRCIGNAEKNWLFPAKNFGFPIPPNSSLSPLIVPHPP